jgi:hypothetical protein
MEGGDRNGSSEEEQKATWEAKLQVREGDK